jgi:amino acid transporter
MGGYWKRRFYQKRTELYKQRRKMKILLGVIIGLIVIFSSLIAIGYVGIQIQLPEKTPEELKNESMPKWVEHWNEWNRSIQNGLTLYEIIVTLLVIGGVVLFVWSNRR